MKEAISPVFRGVFGASSSGKGFNPSGLSLDLWKVGSTDGETGFCLEELKGASLESESPLEEVEEDLVITEYLVKVKEKARILEHKRRYLKITILTTNMPYPSRKIRRICACTHQRPRRKQDPIRRI
ncbi:hypothetical protein Tco_0213328 [Tanacetum coccineum]